MTRKKCTPVAITHERAPFAKGERGNLTSCGEELGAVTWVELGDDRVDCDACLHVQARRALGMPISEASKKRFKRAEPKAKVAIGEAQKKASNLAPLMTSGKQTWRTPGAVLNMVRAVGPIGLDPCGGLGDLVNARVSYRLPIDGLATRWDVLEPGEVAYVNPPYSEVARWSEAIYASGSMGKVEIIALVPARTDTAWWNDWLAPPLAQAVCFWRGRIKFVGGSNSAPFPSALVYFGPRADRFAEVFSPRGAIWRAS